MGVFGKGKQGFYGGEGGLEYGIVVLELFCVENI